MLVSPAWSGGMPRSGVKGSSEHLLEAEDRKAPGFLRAVCVCPPDLLI